MDNIFRCIEEDASGVLSVLKLSLDDLRLGRGTRRITDKKAMIYCYLRHECGYSWHEIANYTHKCHTTIVKVVAKHKDKYGKIRHKLTQTSSIIQL